MVTEPPSQYLLIFSPTFLFSFSLLGSFLLLLLLLTCSALVSAAEVAYFSLSPQDYDTIEKDKKNGPANQRILSLKEKPRTLLATILIANNFINIAIVILSDYLLRRIISQDTFDQWAISMRSNLGIEWMSVDSLSHFISLCITVVGVTFLLVLFGEVAPKIYANLNNIRHARFMSGSLVFLSKLFAPLNGLLISISSRIEERVYRQRLLTQTATSKQEIDKAIDLAVEEDNDDVDILKGIIKFGDVTATQIMKSRIDVVGIEITEDFSEVMKVVKDSGFSRIPVYDEDFDNMKGILYVKDLLGHTHEKAEYDWQQLIRSNVLYIPESKKIDELLKEFQQKHTHMAIVVDEYGGTSGLVTLEDIMEEVIGDIRDEFDSDEEVDYTKIDDHNYIFEGKTLLNDVARITGLDTEAFAENRGSADSLAGLILELEGKIPKRDRVISYGSLKFKIVSANNRRIEKINITL